jgi:hypothetical protein
MAMISILLLLQVHLVATDIITACGLFAFIGPNPDTFSWDKFNILGLFNDVRGGDACGRVSGNICQHGVRLSKTYKNFAVDVEIPSEPVGNTVLGHCRKASSGGYVDEYAQPIVLRKKDINMKAIKDTHLKKEIKILNPDDIVFSGIHNGTIYNYRELAPKYGIPIEDHNDSKVLLSALFYGNTDILLEYTGSAVVVWHNHIYNKTYIFKGESKDYVSSTTTKEERPLYCWVTDNRDIYFSSIEDSLIFIGAPLENVSDVKTNTLFIFKDGLETKTIKMDRTSQYQTNVTVPIKGAYNNSYDDRDDYASYGRSYFRNSCNNRSSSRVPSCLPPIDSLPFDEDKQKRDFLLVPSSRDLLIRQFDICKEPFRLQAEINDSCVNRYPRQAVFNKGRYWMNGGLMHGIYPLSCIGQVPVNITRDMAAIKLYYFVEGIMLDGIFSYHKVIQLHDVFMNDCYQNVTDICDLEQDFTRDIVKHSRYASCSLTKTEGFQDIYSPVTNKNNVHFYNDSFQPLFANRRYQCHLGALTSIIISNSGIKSNSHNENDNDVYLEYVRKCYATKGKNSDPVHDVGYEILNNDYIYNPMSPFQSLLLGLADFSSSLNIKIFFIHYIRDFMKTMKQTCKMCPNIRTHQYTVCLECHDIAIGLQKLQTLSLNGTDIKSEII